MVAPANFSCECGRIKGEARVVPKAGNHLVCFCDSCRAGALLCGATLKPDEPVDLYLTPPQHVSLSEGQDQLAPFAFSPKGIVRWKASCCGVQMFSSQANPKIAFMSIRNDRFADPSATGPVVTQAFVPKSNGKTGHKGMGPLIQLILAAVISRLTGQWRKTPLYDATTLKPVAPVTLISREQKTAVLNPS